MYNILKLRSAKCVLGLAFALTTSVFVDIDHFIAARSIYPSEARKLPGRPFAHFYTGLVALILVSNLFFYTIAYYRWRKAGGSLMDFIPVPADGRLRATLFAFWSILIGWFSHLCRDAIHAGLWIWPPPSAKTLTSHCIWPKSYCFFNTDELSPLQAYSYPLIYCMLQWYARQSQDYYVKKARFESYRCRSAFKLIQMDEKISGRLFHEGMLVIDCGAAPGSWSQVAIKSVRPPHQSCEPDNLTTISPTIQFTQKNKLVYLDLYFDSGPITRTVKLMSECFVLEASPASFQKQQHSSNYDLFMK
ncbi:rRNA methyltransferase 2, mitochondrial [Cichlidogyrus casuarinus]|uniref:rRNA methyltransferase 2, mitochondrial n=1 Tax=Cichlidogyrus casuarinus TaxID=1844966 RepID=A0ABD2QHB6_9PLAT